MLSTEEYLASRKALIAQEQSHRTDHGRMAHLTDAEVEAERIVREIRKKEAETIWNNPSEEFQHLFPGMEFLTAKSTIEKTRLFKIMKKLPKGALLHAHFDAMNDVAFLLKTGLKFPAIHVRAPAIITGDNVRAVLPELQPLKPSEFNTSVGVTDSGYIPGTWVQIQTAREQWPASLGSADGFDEWIIRALTINPEEAYRTHNTTKKIWAKFASTFMIAAGLIRYEPIFREYVRELLISSVEDGISYIEARLNFLPHFMYRENGEEDMTHREWMVIIDEVIKEVKEYMKSQGRQDEFVGAKIIYSTLRFISCEQLEWYLADCIALKQEFPHIIAGFDLVGHEDSLHPLIYYIEPLLRFKAHVQELGLNLPFIFHAGETLGDGDAVDHNLFDALLLGTKRIGHGFSLVKHPELIKLCKERGIAIEMCPISNEILRLTSSMPMHPLPILLANGLTVALSCDDPAIFGNLGLSFDFFQVLVASEVTGLITLGVMARRSLEFSELDPDDKARAIALWEKRWSAFIDAIVADEI